MFGSSPSGGGGFAGSGPRFPQLDRQEINSFIEDFASNIKYWKAMQCPCMTSATGQPNVACHQCRGLGKFHLDYERDIKYQRAQVHARQSQRQRQRAGTFVQGSASITFKEGIVPADGDLIQVCADREVINDEFHVVGAILTDGSTAETLRFRDVVCVEMVAVFDQATKTAKLLDPSGWKFDPTSRRVILTDGVVGTRYSVRYLAVPEYIVMGETVNPLLRVTHDDGAPEPQRYTQDIVYPYNCQAVRLDRAITSRLRGAVDLTTQSTYNNPKGRGPFR